jgi:hypothetical protein
MKYLKEEINSTDKTRFVIALGKKEARIMFSLLLKAEKYMPRISETTEIVSSIGNMRRCLQKLVKEMPDDKI